MEMFSPNKPSSRIRSVGHDPETNTLAVQFHGGGTYQYFGVPESHYQALMSADSPGQHFHQNILGKFKHQKMRE